MQLCKVEFTKKSGKGTVNNTNDTKMKHYIKGNHFTPPTTAAWKKKKIDPEIVAAVGDVDGNVPGESDSDDGDDDGLEILHIEEAKE